MKVYRGSTGIAALILNMGTRWGVNGQTHSHLRYPPDKSPRHSFNRRVDGPQSMCESLRRKGTCLALAGNGTPARPVRITYVQSCKYTSISTAYCKSIVLLPCSPRRGVLPMMSHM